MSMFCKTSLILLQMILISMKISAQVANPLLFQLNTSCHCNGNSEYDFSLGQEIGHCNSLFPYGSPNGHLWCYVDQVRTNFDTYFLKLVNEKNRMIKVSKTKQIKNLINLQK